MRATFPANESVTPDMIRRYRRSGIEAMAGTHRVSGGPDLLFFQRLANPPLQWLRRQRGQLSMVIADDADELPAARFFAPYFRELRCRIQVLRTVVLARVEAMRARFNRTIARRRID